MFPKTGLAYFFATTVALGAFGCDGGDNPQPRANKDAKPGVATSCGNAIVEQQLGEQCDPNDPATKLQAGTNMPCNPQTCTYTPPPGPPQQFGGCPQPVAQLQCDHLLKFRSEQWNGAQQQIENYNATCGGNTPGPEVAYSFTTPVIPGKPLVAIPVTVWVNDGNNNEDLDLFVIAPSDDAVCTPQNCIDAAQRSLTFLALPGQNYTFMVDGRQPQPFSIQATCDFNNYRVCQSSNVGTVCN